MYPPDMDLPLRISFFDDEIDQLKTFNPDDQRSIEGMKKVGDLSRFIYTLR